MAQLYHPDGDEPEVLEFGHPLGLDDLYRLLGCEMVEQIHLDGGRSMWVDEEGKGRKPLPAINDRATEFLHRAGGVPWDVVVGRALVTEPGEVG